MNNAQRHLMTIFSSALERASESERAAYLEAACGPDAALRGRVESLLRAHDRAGQFLEPRRTADPVAIVGPAETVDALGPPPGAVIAGRYKLLEIIGEGGMGEVWLAEQTEPVRRKVALKLIKPGMDSRQVLARFEAERQALALMDHPNIAKILDGGQTGVASDEWGVASKTSEQSSSPATHHSPPATPSRPFFVMEADFPNSHQFSREGRQFTTISCVAFSTLAGHATTIVNLGAIEAGDNRVRIVYAVGGRRPIPAGGQRWNGERRATRSAC